MRAGPLRSCVACRAVRPRAELIRFHARPGEGLSVDLGAGSGRGAYLCPLRSCLERAVARGELWRRLGVSPEPASAETLQGLIRRRAAQKVVSLLGLARRARKVAGGRDAVEAALRHGAARLVLVAGDASPGSVAMIRSLASSAGTPCHEFLSRDDLGAAVGGPPRSCIALTDSRFSEAVISVLGRMPEGPEPEARGGTGATAPTGREETRNGWR